jgi:DNA-directed RNA polymerase sigma subunit (sigma70/sigma32)
MNDPINVWLTTAAKEREKHGSKTMEYFQALKKNCSEKKRLKLQENICKGNLLLISMVVKGYMKKHQSIGPERHLELLQEGYFGLRRAVEKYDVTRGYAFSTYAVNWIRQSVHRYDKVNQSPIRIPENQLNEVLYQIKHGKCSGSKYASKDKGLTLSAHQALNVISLDVPVKEISGKYDRCEHTLKDIIPNDRTLNQSSGEWYSNFLEAKIEAANLEEDEAKVVRFFAYKGRKDLTIAIFRKSGEVVAPLRKLESGLGKLRALAEEAA